MSRSRTDWYWSLWREGDWWMRLKTGVVSFFVVYFLLGLVALPFLPEDKSPPYRPPATSEPPSRPEPNGPCDRVTGEARAACLDVELSDQELLNN